MSSPEQYQVKYDPSNINYYLLTHDLYTTSSNLCTLKENRFRTPYKDANGQTASLYCWRGRIQTTPDCVIGSVCDPYSYTNARSSFCRTWGCQPNLYVSNEGTLDAGTPVINQRGGLVVYTPKTECEGGIARQFNCMLSGVRQSFANAVDPKNRKKLMMSVITLSAALVVGIILLRRYRQKTRGKKFFKGIRS